MSKPNKDLIELCEDLLGRARSGELRGLAAVEIRSNDRINASFRAMDAEESMKAVTFMGHLVAKSFMNIDDKT